MTVVTSSGSPGVTTDEFPLGTATPAEGVCVGRGCFTNDDSAGVESVVATTSEALLAPVGTGEAPVNTGSPTKAGNVGSSATGVAADKDESMLPPSIAELAGLLSIQH